MADSGPSVESLRRQWADTEPLLLVHASGVIAEAWGDVGAWFEDGVVGRRLADLFAAPSQSSVHGAVAGGLLAPEELRPSLPDGRRLALSASACDGGWLIRLRDVTADRVLSEAMAHRERMQALAGIASAVSRELNDPMSIVQGRLELLLALGDVDPTTQKHLDVALEHARRISATLRNLRVVGQHREHQLEVVEVSVALRGALDLLGPRGERVEADIEPPDLAVAGDEAMLTRVLANALRQSIEGVARGAVVLRARREADRVVLRIDVGRRGRAEPLDGADITIDETLLRSVGGHISAFRVAGAPAFVVELPLPPAVRGRARPVESDMLVVGGQGFIDTVQQLLDKDGYRFAFAGQADQALRALAEPIGEAPSAVVTELLLPGSASGLALGLAIAERHPELRGRVVVVTEAPIGQLPEPIVQLPMPMSRASLLDALGRRVRRA